MAAKAKFKPITADQLLELVRSGAAIEYRTIDDLGKLLSLLGEEAPGRKIQLTGCKILACRCTELTVKNPLTFGPPTEEPRTHQHTHFECSAMFERAIFEHPVDFRSVIFSKIADFAAADFKTTADFRQTVFSREACFAGAVFEQDALFSEALFHSHTQFLAADFRRHADFTKVQFALAADFRFAVAGAQIDFTEARFDSTVNVYNLRFAPGAHILLDLDQIGRYQIPGWLPDLLDRLYTLTIQIYFKFFRCLGVLDAAGEEKMLVLFRRLFENLRIFARRTWPCVRLIEGEDAVDKEKLKSAAAQYAILKDNFHSLPSRAAVEDRCHYKYKDLTRRAMQKKHFRKFFNWLLAKWAFGYGVYPKRILVTALLVVVFFAAIYSNFTGVLKAPFIKDVPVSDPLLPFYFSLVTFLTFGSARLQSLGLVALLAACQSLVGVILTVIFAFCLARKLIR